MGNIQFSFEGNYLYFCTNIAHYTRTYRNAPTHKADIHLKHQVELEPRQLNA
jgi:hypothetical protein